VHHLVELAQLRLPEAHIAGVLLTDGEDAREVAEPLAGLAGVTAVRAQLIEVAVAGRRLQRELR
jgi:hypothetical protein